MGKQIELLFLPQIIRASAGSGKTFALSSRCINLLAAGIPASSLLASTFTRKAAGEIYARVVLRLASAFSSPKELDTLNSQLGLTLSASALEKLFLGILTQPHQFRVCTLDSFFSGIAGSFQFELGLPDGWSIGEWDAQVKIQERTLRKLCASLPAEEYDILNDFLSGETTDSLVKELSKQLPLFYEIARETEYTAWNWLVEKPILQVNEIQGLRTQISDFELPRTKTTNEISKHWQNSVNSILAAMAGQHWNQFLSTGLVKSVLENKQKFSHHQIPNDLSDALLKLGNHALYLRYNRLIQRQKACHKLLLRYGEIIESLRDETGLLHFSDIKFRLARASVLGNLEEIYYRLSSRIDHLLLDEFQDTSLSQWQVVAPLCLEILSAPAEPRSFFCVGDTKQAIYGWRGGSAEIFERLEEAFPILEGRSVAFNTSRRSSIPVIEAVNKVFGNLAQSESMQAYPSVVNAWSKRFEAHETTRTTAPGYVELRSYPETEEDAELRSRETILLVKELHKKHPQASIGILVRKNSTIEELLAQCARSETFIRASGEGGTPLVDSPAVVVLLSALELCDHPGHSECAYVVLHSPLANQFGLNASPQSLPLWLQKLRELVSAEGLGSCVRQLAEALTPYYSLRDARRLKQVTELAYQATSAPALRLKEFVIKARSTKREDKEQASVRIMTIHQSKGLEFDIVLLPELEEDLSKLLPGTLLTERASAFAPIHKVALYPNAEIRKAEPLLDQMYQNERSRIVNEGLSLLYVALTRARHALYLLHWKTARKGSGLSASNLLLETLRSPETPSAENQSEGPGAYTIEYQNGDSELDCLFAASVDTPSPKTMQLDHRTEFILPAPQARDRIFPRQHAADFITTQTKEQLLEKISRLSPNTRRARERGTYLHHLLQQIKWYTSHETEEIKELLTRSPELLSLFDQRRYATAESVQVFQELPFAYRSGDSIHNGVIDRLVLGISDNKPESAEIIDFKTDTLASLSASDKSEKIQMYARQLSFYADAVHRIFNVERTQIKASLAFVSSGEVMEISL